MSTASAVRFSVLLFATLVVACGGGERSDGDAAAMPQDTFVKNIEREPLSDADMVGLDMAQLALELPWTQNMITRDAAAGAAAVAVRAVETAGHEGFDRVVFTLDEAMAGTGYEIRIAAAGETVACGAESRTLAAARTLVVAFAPARAGTADGPLAPSGVRATGATRMARAGLLCDVDDAVIWVAELAGGDQVRVLELRDPGRIVVDVR